MAARFLQAGLIVICIGAPAPAQSSMDNGPAIVIGKTRISYQRWLNVDVRWIITPEERTAFLRLSKDEDRDRFIEAFWLRRDPTPGTQANEFKQEHYRRIAYSNVQFEQKIPGWETDRGRIYIVYGPPEGIKTDLARRSDDPAKPAQVWHYHSIPGLGDNIDLKFEDVCRCGDYRLETPLKNRLIHDP
jgi:GWxTD domain-containing protein